MGLNTLRGFFKIKGFVLTPEVHIIHEWLQNGQKGRELKMGQKRICFTHIDESHIKEHAKVFGPFSIEFDLIELNHAGAMPAFYYPIPEKYDDLAGLTQALIVVLGDLWNLTSELKALKEKLLTSPNGNDLATLSWGEGNDKKETSLTVDSLNAVLAYLEHKHGSALTLRGNINGLTQLFSPTHNKSYTGPFAYYQQHEWRIVSDIAMMGEPLSRVANDTEKKILLSSNRPFFGKIVEMLNNKKCPRIDECWVYHPPGVKHIMELAKRIIVPQECIEEAHTIVKEAGFSGLNIMSIS